MFWKFLNFLVWPKKLAPRHIFWRFFVVGPQIASGVRFRSHKPQIRYLFIFVCFFGLQVSGCLFNSFSFSFLFGVAFGAPGLWLHVQCLFLFFFFTCWALGLRSNFPIPFHFLCFLNSRSHDAFSMFCSLPFHYCLGSRSQVTCS